MKKILLIATVLAAEGPTALKENFRCDTSGDQEKIEYTVKDGD